VRYQQLRSIIPAAVCATALAIAFSESPTAQQPAFRSGANYVRVDVYPTAGGKPVEDLTAADFQLLEDGKPQTIDAFEHVHATTVRFAPPRDTARATASPRHQRVFIVFLDTGHVTTLGSTKVAEPLIRLLDTVVGDTDAVGVMTPDMTPSQMVLGPKRDVLARALRDHPTWGRRYDRATLDRTEQGYVTCYPLLKVEAEAQPGRLMSELAQKMIERRRERNTLDALNTLVTYLGDLAETRKTIFAVTEGWVLYGSDQQMLEPRHLTTDPRPFERTEPVPGRPGITVGRDGKLTTDDPSNLRSVRYPCEADRLALASADDHQYFKDIIGNANRSNASFYTIDPRGLAVFNAEVQWERPAREPLPLTADADNLRSSHSSMRTLASETDGFAVIGSNDLDRGVRRIAEDLSSYYLLSYYSTNARPDGKFREITVRVTRPGVDVRARRGYRAPTTAELAAATVAARSAPSARAAADTALAELDLKLLRKKNAGGPQFFRRGPGSGNKLVPADLPLFSRTDRVHVELRVASGAATGGAARLLDRTGQPLPVPLIADERTDEGGQRWMTVDLALAPLAAGDYIIELAPVAGEKTLSAIRVTR
jgi:VWFA-related protein